MFLQLFYTLRSLDVMVSPTEWMTLMEAVGKGLHNDSLDDFYFLSRSLLVKDVAKYDAFDQAFSHVFKNGPVPDSIATKEQILDWLEAARDQLYVSPEDLERMKHLSLEELLKELEDRLQTQKEAHHGGQHWIGSGGTSPFGMKGAHPTGISFSPVRGGGGAMLQAFERKYKNLRNDLTIDVRQMSVALKRLRVLRQNPKEEMLDLDLTIDKTCKNGGEIDLVFGAERENQVRLILAMDTGGSMEPYRRISETLFSAANGINHFKEFSAYYFHNCVYDNLYEDIETYKYKTVDDLIKNSKGEGYRLILMGDASMAPYELMIPNGTLERKRSSDVKGIDRLRMLKRAFPKSVWLNPVDEDGWHYYQTVGMVREVFPMFPLTVAGIERAVKELL